MSDGLAFSAQVSDWVRGTKDRMDRVFRASVQEIVSVASNNVPVDTGFARASVRGSRSEMPSIDPAMKNESGATVQYTGTEVVAVIAGLKVGDEMWVGWTASYALALEYGHSKQAPAGFVRLAAQQWPSVVSRISEQAETRAASA